MHETFTTSLVLPTPIGHQGESGHTGGTGGMGLTHTGRAARGEAPSSQRMSAAMTGELVLRNGKGLTKRAREEVPGRRGQCWAGCNCAQAGLSLTVCQSRDPNMASGPTWIPAETRRRNPAPSPCTPSSPHVDLAGSPSRDCAMNTPAVGGRGGCLTGRVSWRDLELFVQCVSRKS